MALGDLLNAASQSILQRAAQTPLGQQQALRNAQIQDVQMRNQMMRQNMLEQAASQSAFADPKVMAAMASYRNQMLGGGAQQPPAPPAPTGMVSPIARAPAEQPKAPEEQLLEAVKAAVPNGNPAVWGGVLEKFMPFLDKQVQSKLTQLREERMAKQADQRAAFEMASLGIRAQSQKDLQDWRQQQSDLRSRELTQRQNNFERTYKIKLSGASPADKNRLVALRDFYRQAAQQVRSLQSNFVAADDPRMIRAQQAMDKAQNDLDTFSAAPAQGAAAPAVTTAGGWKIEKAQ